MKTYSFYDKSTGLFTGTQLKCSGNPVEIELNTPEGQAAHEGEIDHLKQRMGPDGELETYVPDKPPAEDHLDYEWNEALHGWVPFITRAGREANVRAERDARLAACDWVVVKANEKGEPVQPEWQAYRQALRDITSAQGFPDEVVWPTRPD